MTSPKEPRPRARAGRPRQPVAKETLLLLASRVFAEQGFRAASLDTIAQEAGITKQALLHHFHGKETLYLAALDQHVIELSRLVMAALVSHGDFAERLDHLGEVVVDYFGAHPEVAGLLLRDVMDNGPYVRRQGQSLIQHVLDMSFHFVRGGLAGTALSDDEVRHVTLSIVSMHLFYFAVPTVTLGLAGESALQSGGLEHRKRMLKAAIRRLCGLG